MDDRIQVAEAKEDLQGIEAKPEVVVAYDVKTDTCTMKTVPNGAHASTDDTLEPMASVSEQQHNTVLLREGEKSPSFSTCVRRAMASSSLIGPPTLRGRLLRLHSCCCWSCLLSTF